MEEKEFLIEMAEHEEENEPLLGQITFDELLAELRLN